MVQPIPEPYICLVTRDEPHVSVGGLLGQERAQGRNESASTTQEKIAHDKKEKVKEGKEAQRKESCDEEQCNQGKENMWVSIRVKDGKRQVRKNVGARVDGILKDIF